MKAISLFSGAGGLDYGFRKAGADLVWANEINESFCRTYEKNIEEPIVCADIRCVSPSEVPQGDIMMGGFPCLGFTIARGKRRTVHDEKNLLYKYFLRLVKDKQPELFLIENVPGMKQGKKFETLFETLLKEFADAGYSVRHHILNAVHYGVPQFRKRVIILGIRDGSDIQIDLPKRTHAKSDIVDLYGNRLQSYVTIKDAIDDLPEPGKSAIKNHVGTKHRVKLNGYMGNRRLFWDRPSPTIIGRGSLTGGPVIHPHPNLTRRLTVRECARLQSFPDDFEFEGSMTACYAQVGNAVPPLFAFRLAQAVMRAFKREPKSFRRAQWALPWVDKIPEI